MISPTTILNITTMLAIGLLLSATVAAVLCTAFFRLRRRHRDLRHTLVRVATERDQLRLELTGQVQPTGVCARG